MGTETWNPERRKAWMDEVVRATEDDDEPNPDAWGGAEPGVVIGIREAPTPNGHAQPEPADPDAFGWQDLRGIASSSCEKFPMPGGKHVWVFPFSGGLVHELTLRSGGLSLKIDPGDDAVARDAKVRAASVELQAHQVSLVCFRDREGKKPSFGPGHVPAILAELPYTTIKGICERSERMIAQPKKEELIPFGQDAESCLRTWFSASEGWEGCPAGLREMTEDLLSRAPAWS